MISLPSLPSPLTAPDTAYVVADLTAIEKAVLIRIARGYPINQIVGELHVCRDYVYLTLRQLRGRFFAGTNAAMIARAIQFGVITPDGEYCFLPEKGKVR